MKKIWKQYDEFHEVSNYGDVRICKKHNSYLVGYIFSQRKLTKTGYRRVCINHKAKMVHRLVAELFVPNDDPITKTEINHINFNRSDNRAFNLEWVSHKENIRKSAKGNHAYDFGRKTLQIIDVKNGKTYDSCKQFAKDFGVTPSAITNAIRRGSMCCGRILKQTGKVIRYNKMGKIPDEE